MPLSFMTDSVTVWRAELITKNGQQVRDWRNATSHTVTDCLVTPQSTSREFDGRVTQVTDRRTLRTMYDADIVEGDRVEWCGNTYEIDGEVFHTKSPTGRISTTRCSIIRWEG